MEVEDLEARETPEASCRRGCGLEILDCFYVFCRMCGVGSGRSCLLLSLSAFMVRRRCYSLQ
jgi:hypothetical protein